MQTPNILITERANIQFLLGMDWLREFNWTFQNIENATKDTDQSENKKIIPNFEKLIRTNRIINDTEARIQTKQDHLRMKPKAKPLPHLLKDFVLIEKKHSTRHI